MLVYSPSTEYFASFDDNSAGSSSHNQDYNHHYNNHNNGQTQHTVGYYQRQANASYRNGNEHGPAAQVMVMTQGRRVQSSLHRHEQQQDEFYQL